MRTIDEYLASLRPDQRAALEKVRRAVRAAAPRAEEGWSYGLPAFRLGGQPIAAIAAHAEHCSYYPMSGKVVAALGDALARYETTKGAIRFRPGSVPPTALIRKLVKARIAELTPAPGPGRPARPGPSRGRRAARQAIPLANRAK